MCYCTVFGLFFCFLFEGNFQAQVPGGLYLTKGLLCFEFEWLIFGGAYFRNFAVARALRKTNIRRLMLETSAFSSVTLANLHHRGFW